MIENVTDEQLRQHLYSPEAPDIDLIIRTSGESRLSGFLLWQSAYSEVIFQDVYWPEFRKIDFSLIGISEKGDKSSMINDLDILIGTKIWS